jgi:hypothetical protein
MSAHPSRCSVRSMMKMVVYRWRTSATLLKGLRIEGRKSRISLRALLERIVIESLRKRRSIRALNGNRLYPLQNYSKVSRPPRRKR